jgi:prepilin-type N-terminal cleavage/methylation domain-containing protein
MGDRLGRPGVTPDRVRTVPRIRAGMAAFPTVSRVLPAASYQIPSGDRTRCRAGFSFLEVAVVLVLLSMLAAIGYTGFASLRANTEGTAAGPMLTVAQLEARRLSSPDGGFAEDALEALVALSDASLTFTSAASTDTETVSVYRIDEESLVLAMVSGEDCLVLLDRPFASSTWAVFRTQADACLASTLAGSIAGRAQGGSPTLPQEVTGG